MNPSSVTIPAPHSYKPGASVWERPDEHRAIVPIHPAAGVLQQIYASFPQNLANLKINLLHAAQDKPLASGDRLGHGPEKR
jgi:hypothetical protein